MFSLGLRHNPGAPGRIQEGSPTTGGTQEPGVPLWDKALFIGMGMGSQIVLLRGALGRWSHLRMGQD